MMDLPAQTPPCDASAAPCATTAGGKRVVDCAMMHTAISTLVQTLSMASWNQDPHSAQRLLADVRGVRQDLRDHIASMEAADGIFTCIGARCPHLLRDLEILGREHEGMDQQLAELELRLQTHGVDDPGDVRFIRQAARQLLLAMREHQEAGNSLVLQAYNTDLGLGD